MDLKFPKVVVLTGTTGRPELKRNIESVKNQKYDGEIQHLIFVDGQEAIEKVESWLSHPKDVDMIYLPYPCGNNRWNSHRHYAAGTYLAHDDAEYIMFLDDDNYLDENHINDCFCSVNRNNLMSWSYSLRKIVSVDGTFLCKDDCESLGNWASVIDQNDYFVDVNCYFLPRKIAVFISPLWYRKFREPGQPEIDRVIHHALRTQVSLGICTGEYSVNYAVASNSQLSVKPEFFINGNKIMMDKYNGEFPWQKK
jgi:hypothetical protein